jgi:5-methylcytosine-specific restriction enzyme subunit McrC
VKTTLVSVREHAWLTTEAVIPSLDCGLVSVSAFDYLCALNETFTSGGARLAQVAGRRRLKLDNFVGVVQTPCGTVLEIVPKHHAAGGSLDDGRALLRKLLLSMLDLPTREVGQAPLMLFDAPLSEWVMRRFLNELDALLKRGLRFDYHRIDDQLPFLRGQLNLLAQLRQPPGKGHQFHVRHDAYIPNRAENRLLRLALDQVRISTQQTVSWRLAQELSIRMAEIPASKHVAEDFRVWGRDRLMAHYRCVKPWCELILNQQMPLAVLGEHHGISLLFPMEKLFEGFVTGWLRRRLAPELDIQTPARSASLCTHMDRSIFRLEPDILISSSERLIVLDTKWKLLDAFDRMRKYGLSQSDFYQLFAYGQKYLQGPGQMALIYPRTEAFSVPLEPFDFGGGLTLAVLPFDLDEEVLIGAERLGLSWRPETRLKSLSASADMFG